MKSSCGHAAASTPPAVASRADHEIGSQTFMTGERNRRPSSGLGLVAEFQPQRTGAELAVKSLCTRPTGPRNPLSPARPEYSRAPRHAGARCDIEKDMTLIANVVQLTVARLRGVRICVIHVHRRSFERHCGGRDQREPFSRAERAEICEYVMEFARDGVLKTVWSSSKRRRSIGCNGKACRPRG